ncbi:FOG: Ankyrin repeat [Hahella chejuensis KCTC 2396]|uniref:FOG: Ankyrin repeat n=1 Tax=Hahella chejuensis (strain KCTC 2396) TaxID=349521 RepID=Q2SFE7_HAHCH|nr:ankyrin repeat domain-containing protein [Hahella chejuensis]ABC30627.1 FOG: Ankyrin repeat [Hahella chejuensis KCTC 2396]
MKNNTIITLLFLVILNISSNAFSSTIIAESSQETTQHEDNIRALINKPDEQGWPPLFHAIDTYYRSPGKEELNKIRALLDMGADVNLRSNNDFKMDAFNYSYLRDFMYPVMDLLLDYGANIDSISGRSRITALSKAISKRDIVATKYFISRGANVNANDGGHTILNQSVFNGDIDIINILLESGADPNLSGNGIKPIDIAVGEKRKDIIGALVENGAKVSILPAVLSASEDDSNIEIIGILIDSGADIDEKGDNGNTALHRALYRRNHELVSFLIRSGASVNIKNDAGITPKQIMKKESFEKNHDE